MDEEKILYNFFYLVAQDILDHNDKLFTPYKLHEIASAMVESEDVENFRSHYEEWMLEFLEEVK